jgi:hypothetical protein
MVRVVAAGVSPEKSIVRRTMPDAVNFAGVIVCGMVAPLSAP